MATRRGDHPLLPGIPESPLEAALALLRRTDVDPLRVWRRILANESAYPAYSVKCAREVMGLHPPPEREPGEEG